MLVFRVVLQVLLKFFNSSGKQGNLHVSRTGVFVVQLKSFGDVARHTFILRHEWEFSGLIGLFLSYLWVIVADFDNRINILCASSACAMFEGLQFNPKKRQKLGRTYAD